MFFNDTKVTVPLLLLKSLTKSFSTDLVNSVLIALKLHFVIKFAASVFLRISSLSFFKSTSRSVFF